MAVPPRVDIVSVFCRRDLEAQLLQARSITRFFSADDLGSVLYVCNDPGIELSEELLRSFEHALPPGKLRMLWYSDLGLSAAEVGEDGWTTQQVLKLLAATAVPSSHYLVLDAKNHFIQPTFINDFFTPSGRLKQPLTDLGKSEAMQFAIAHFGVIDPPRPMRGFEGVTPAIFMTDVVKDLIQSQQEREGKSLCAIFFQHHGKLTEFHAYQAFLLRQGRRIDEVYEDSWDINWTFWEWVVRNPAIFGRFFAQCEAGRYRLMGVHWLAAQVLDEAGRRSLVSLWRKAGLIQSEAEAERVLAWQTANLSGGDRMFMSRVLGKAALC